MKTIKTADFLKKTSSRLPQNIKSQIQKQIYEVTKDYHDQIPLQSMFDVLKSFNIVPLQEDGTLWSGMLIGGAECGSDEVADQIAGFDLAFQDPNQNRFIPINNTLLQIQWCKMPSGKYEVVAYLS